MHMMDKEAKNDYGADASSVSEGQAQQPMIRSNLADSAVWITSVKTNEQGEASLDFALPDNLTTWSLRSWVMGPQTQVGEAKVEIVTRKNLMVRLQAPRFFVEKDEVVISANVHNEMDKAQEVQAVLERAQRSPGMHPEQHARCAPYAEASPPWSWPLWPCPWCCRHR